MDVNANQLETLALQKNLIGKNVKAEQERTNSERERLTAAGRGLENEISQVQAQIKLQRERLQVAEGDLATADQLKAKGFMTAVEQRRRQVALLEQRQVLSNLNQQLAAKQNQLTEMRFSLRQLPTLMEQKVQSLRNDLATTEQRIAEIKGRGAYVIRAPTAGRVSTMQATVGQRPTRSAFSSRSYPRTRRSGRSCFCRPARSASSRRASACASCTMRSPTSTSGPTTVGWSMFRRRS